MPLEIRELNIRVNVGGDASGANASGSRGSDEAASDKDEMLSECVDEVLRVLRDRKER